MTYVEFRKFLYLAQMLFGLFLLSLGFATSQTNDFTQQTAAGLMIMSGSGLIVFGILAVIFRDDPDILR